MIRAFIAVEIDHPHKQKISDIISDLKKSNADVKWVTENQMHLTLKFLGNIEKDKAQAISAALESIGNKSNGFNISLSKLGAFPDMRQPKVIWLGIENGGDKLKLLAAQIETELERMGFPKEKREYKAHLTLGRVKSLKNTSNLTDLILKTNFHSEDKIKIDKITLYQSTLTPKGPIYTPLAQISLRF